MIKSAIKIYYYYYHYYYYYKLVKQAVHNTEKCFLLSMVQLYTTQYFCLDATFFSLLKAR